MVKNLLSFVDLLKKVKGYRFVDRCVNKNWGQINTNGYIGSS